MLYQRWTATPVNNWTAAGIPSADGNLARGAVVDAGRDFVGQLSRNLSEAGLQTRYPLIIWRDREGFMKACACSDARSWAFIRDDLDAPDRIAPAAPAADGQAPLPYPDGGPAPQSLPYPTLPQVTPVPGQVPAQPGVAQPATPGATPAPARPAQPSAPRKAPEPRQQEDTTFY